MPLKTVFGGGVLSQAGVWRCGSKGGRARVKRERESNEAEQRSNRQSQGQFLAAHTVKQHHKMKHPDTCCDARW